MKKYLELLLRQGRLANCWLIRTDNPAISLKNLNLFIETGLLENGISLTSHPDYRLVECDHAGASRGITIEQIRTLQGFFSKTPSISKYRIAVIFQADLMNLNAANSCLKLLEDTPQDSFIFLITSKPGAILSTIKSRCAKISDAVESSIAPNKCIDYMANYFNPESRIALIEEFASKDRELWRNFAYSTIDLINKRIKKSLNIDVYATSSEEIILKKLERDSTSSLLQKYAYIKARIDETIQHDLDLRVSTIEIMEELYSTNPCSRIV